MTYAYHSTGKPRYFKRFRAFCKGGAGRILLRYFGKKPVPAPRTWRGLAYIPEKVLRELEKAEAAT